MTLCSTKYTETKFLRKLRMLSCIMNYHRRVSNDIVHHVPKIKQHFSGVDHLYRLQNIKVYHRAEIQLFVSRWLNMRRRRTSFNKPESALKPPITNLFYNYDGLHRTILWVVWMHPADIFWNASLAKYFPRIEAFYHWSGSCDASAILSA